MLDIVILTVCNNVVQHFCSVFYKNLYFGRSDLLCPCQNKTHLLCVVYLEFFFFIKISPDRMEEKYSIKQRIIIISLYCGNIIIVRYLHSKWYAMIHHFVNNFCQYSASSFDILVTEYHETGKRGKQIFGCSVSKYPSTLKVLQQNIFISFRNSCASSLVWLNPVDITKSNATDLNPKTVPYRFYCLYLCRTTQDSIHLYILYCVDYYH